MCTSGKVSIRVECDPDAFNDVLIYMYSGRLSVRPEHAVELLWVSCVCVCVCARARVPEHAVECHG
jgi:hypothetical protein